MHWETAGRLAQIHRDELAREAAMYRLAALARGPARQVRTSRWPTLHGVLGVFRMVFRRLPIEVARMAKFGDTLSNPAGVTPSAEVHEISTEVA